MKLLRIKWKNLLSYGDKENSIEFQDSSVNLITGKNGLGKSTAILETVCFLFFGKPHRTDISKNDLINDINGKELFVDGEIQIGNDIFRIVRGIKPNIFEIYKNSELLPQNAANRDYQKILEEEILRMDIHTFKQIIVISTMDYRPFLKLKTQSRREFIERILNLTVFSSMNELNKLHISKIKDSIMNNEMKKDIVENSINLINQSLNLFDCDQEKNRNSLISEISELRDELVKISFDRKNYEEIIIALEQSEKKMNSLDKKINSLKNEYEKTKDKLNSKCPVCGSENNCSLEEKETLEINLDSLKNEIEKKQESISQYKNIHEEFKRIKESEYEKMISHREKKNQIKFLEGKLDSFGNSMENEDYSKMNSLKFVQERELESLNSEISFSQKELKERSYITELLKDSGIKSKIISKTLPLINKTVNEFLNILEFNGRFQFNETFEETINVSGVNKRYPSFSGGQQQRIDLALLFAWRKVSSLLHSCNFNFVVLDEVFSASLDVDGVENMKKILSSLENTTIFLISHNRDVQNDLDFFDNIYEVKKEGNFSKFSLYIN